MTTTTIPAITLWQPWASLVAVGANRYETRSWPAPQTLQPGDLLAIHAAARRPSLGLDAMHWNAALEALRALCMRTSTEINDELPTGSVVAVCEYGGCYRTETAVRDCCGLRRTGTAIHCEKPRELWFGDWSPGRYAWELEVVLDLSDRPIEARGRQRVWQWEPPQWVLSELCARGVRP